MFEVYFEGSDEGGLGEEVGPVIHAVELEDFLDDIAVLVLFDVLLDLNPELEPKLIEPLEFVFLAHELEEPFPLDFNVGHVLIYQY